MAMTFEQYKELRKKGYQPEQLQRLNQEKQPKGFFQKLGESMKQRGGKIVDIAKERPSGVGDALYQVGTKQLRILGQAAGAVFDTTGAVASGAARTGFNALQAQRQQNLKALGSSIAGSSAGKMGLRGIQYGAQVYGDFKERNPRAAETAEAVGNILSVAPVGFGGKLAAKEGVNLAKDAVNVAKQVGKSNIDDVIETGISKGIRPTVVGKNSLGQLKQYKAKAKDAVLNIVKNKENLSYVDEFGESVTGKLPSSLKELTEAVDQTKKRIFSEYSALASKAGGTGVAVDLNKVTGELGKIVNDKVIQTISPETARYASNLIERFSKQGSFTPEQAQQAIANMNASLEAFYKNPTYGTYRQAQIDALITNNLRESLDSVITSATGPGYAELKRAYGALKTIEKDAIKRAVVEGRKNAKGLVDFTDIFSAGDVVMGIATGNMAQVAKGGIQKAVSSYIKRLNSPDNAIKRMFQKVEKAVDTKEFKPQSGTGKALNYVKGKAGLSVEDVKLGKAGYSDPLLQEARKYKSAEDFVKAQSSPSSRFEYHLSTDGKLPEGKTFGDLPKSNEAGVRGGSGSEVFSSKNPAIWHSQLGYEGLGKTPDNVYLVEVKNPQTTKMQVEGGIPKSLQTSNAPSDVRIVKNLGKVGDFFDAGMFEFKKDKALTDLWKKAQGETKRGFGTGAGRGSMTESLRIAREKVDAALKNFIPKTIDEYEHKAELESIKAFLSKKRTAREIADTMDDMYTATGKVMKSRGAEVTAKENAVAAFRKLKQAVSKYTNYEAFLKGEGLKPSDAYRELFRDAKLRK